MADLPHDIQQLLRESEERCRAIFDVTNEAIVIHDPSTGAILDVNKRMLEVFGISYEDALKMSTKDFSDGNPPYSQEQADDFIRKARQEGPQLFEWLSKRSNGERFWTEVSLRSAIINGEQRVVAEIRDITNRRKAQEELRCSEEKFASIFRLSPDSILLTRISDGIVLDCNPAFVEEMGVPYERIVHQTTPELGIWGTPEERAAFLRELGDKGEVINKEQTVVRPDGQARQVLISSRLIKIVNQPVLLSLGRNITEIKAVEKTLQQKNRALNLLYQCNSAVVHASDEQELLHEICRIAVELAGYRMAWIGRAENDEKKTVRPIAFTGPGQFLNELFVSWADNEHGRGTAGTAIRSGKPAVGRDLLNNPHFAVWKQTLAPLDFAAAIAVPLIIDYEAFGVLVIYAAEPDAFDTTEIGLLEKLGKNISHGIRSLRASKERAEALAALEGARRELEKTVTERTRELIKKNQEYVKEIELRKLTEKSLRESERRFRAVFEQAEIGVAIVESKTGRFQQVNQRYCEITNYTEEELLQRTFMSITHPDDVAHDLEETSQLLNGKKDKFSTEKRIIRKDGRPVWIQLFASPLWAPGEEANSHIKVIEDITFRKNAEETLRKSEEKYRELVENANSIILRMDTNGRITFFNEFAQKFFGYREEEVLGKTVIETIVPEKKTRGRDLENMIREIALYPERFVKNENENMRKNGERAWIAWTNKPIFDTHGRHKETLCIGNDITDLKRTETELLHAKDAAESADHLKSAFLAAMSHELRTPLNSIIGFTGIMLQGLPGPLNPEQKKQLGMVNSSAHHLLSLINDVLDLSKIEAGQLEVRREPFDLQGSIRKVVQTVLPLAAKKALAIKFFISPEVTIIIGDQRRVEQILMNLLSNAIKFTDRGEITVECSLKTDTVATSVRDTGIGIRPEQQQELFRPFHQLDSGLTRRHEGTGLGLSICKRLLELMEGSISFVSEFGKGSVFTFVLPINPRSAQ
jgi:PAS domain S-box-containing protein